MRHVRSYKELFENQTELSQEQIEWLDKCTGGKWTLNPQTGLVDVDGGFYCISQNLTDFKGVRFGKVGRNFDCSENEITSLEGAPQEVKGTFNCSENELTSLKGAPQQVEWDFDCSNNRLTSLEGAPQQVGDFNCSNNRLTSLEGAPQQVEDSFYCLNNQLTSLVGAPQTVGGGFFCNDNQLTSLAGAPQTVKWSFNCEGNPASESTLYSIFALIQKGKSYQQALEEYWPKMREEDRVLMYKEMPNLPPEETRKYKALATYSKIKGYL
jgi:hypothetical protein